MAILEVRNIEKHFGRTNVLKDVSFSMEEGNALAIIGSSGSGKTTLLRCLNFLERPDSGQIIVNGETLFDASEAGKDKDAELRKNNGGQGNHACRRKIHAAGYHQHCRGTGNNNQGALLADNVNQVVDRKVLVTDTRKDHHNQYKDQHRYKALLCLRICFKLFHRR